MGFQLFHFKGLCNCFQWIRPYFSICLILPAYLYSETDIFTKWIYLILLVTLLLSLFMLNKIICIWSLQVKISTRHRCCNWNKRDRFQKCVKNKLNNWKDYNFKQMKLLALSFRKNTVAARFHGNWILCGFLNIDFRFLCTEQPSTVLWWVRSQSITWETSKNRQSGTRLRGFRTVSIP
jgi:hypothetical protein